MKLFNAILKWLVALAFSLSAGLLVIIFLSGNPMINPFYLRILILLAVGFVSGLFSRVLFRKGFAILLILISLISSLLAVLVIDYFFESDYVLTFLSREFKFVIPTLQDGAQAGLLIITSLPLLLLFRRKKKSKAIESKPPEPQGPSISDRFKAASSRVNPKNWNIKLPKISAKEKPASSSHRSTKSSAKVHISSGAKNARKTATTKLSSKKASPGKKIKLPGLKPHHPDNDVKLMGEEEHVCPYCLEDVMKRDVRGVVICPECSTWHHKDCWNVTGACGVAHRNKL